MIDILKAAIKAQIPEASSSVLHTLRDQGENITVTLDKELEDAGKEVESSMNERQRQMLDSLDLKKLLHCFLTPLLSSHFFFSFFLDMRSLIRVHIGV